ncbi:Sialic acid synthase [Myotis davidii]|uniref:Sialic acid synthase n=1 Tax=Myotis davidii TaxID=225400 RepID=L5LCK1_MYODS|nr:Sialic acid synthase [Myotis davidii]
MPLELELCPGRWVGEQHPCFTIAEIGQNHQGDLDLAKCMIRVAKQPLLAPAAGSGPNRSTPSTGASGTNTISTWEQGCLQTGDLGPWQEELSRGTEDGPRTAPVPTRALWPTVSSKMHEFMHWAPS